MKLSKETVNLIKNFAGINSNLLLKNGNKLATISAQKNVMADATTTESFPDFAIYDLNEFLGAMSLFDDPELEFQEKYVSIKQGSMNIKFFAADPSVLVAPQKAITFPDAEINFNMSSTMLDMIKKTSSVLRAADVSIVGDGSKVTAVVGDKKNATGNSYSEAIGETDKVFKVNLKVENLKMLPGDYQVSISSKKISRFKAPNTDLVYYVAVEADSTFEF
ncbi:sliding clamp [uncultured Caudovirales phage]|uniref:Sliding clamp n=1 Tax=uncultured Caudovirales phage TaxID=2100421 RepID=A0A6J5PIE7_9CAUD|nr:sliding clamp [uncultured Caudovirales phage]CAB4181950.1 sliding clamp [uncultured Caudovirales phage]CAB4197706.1 sliding clamp [uncultured Caudovirales phage]CAB4211602.1 sliding clamp [uncultured Caudovirales phage]CAB5238715.1 sliding clamp [uncultured Caudovirales phage]